MRVRDMMTSAPRSCQPEDPVERALEHMDAAECGAVPVVDGENRVIGIVTDRDILFGARANGGSLGGLTVERCMTPDPVTVLQDEKPKAVVKKMGKTRVRRVPVVDVDGKLVGIVAQADVALHVDDDEVVAKYLRRVSAAPAVEPAPER